MCGVSVLRPVCFAVIIHAHPTQVGGKQTPGAPQPLPSAGLFLKAQCGEICGTQWHQEGSNTLTNNMEEVFISRMTLIYQGIVFLSFFCSDFPPDIIKY